MSRREVILRDDGDGGKRRHEVELRTWKVTAPSGLSITFESDSWFAARQRGRMEFMTEDVKVEEVEETVNLAAVADVLGALADGASDHCVLSPQLADQMGIVPSADVPAFAVTALERLKNRAKGK